MLSFVAQYGRNIHSQNGEDGILAECVKRLGIEKGHCVEVGASDGLWMSNTRALIERGWSGLFVEADYSLYEQCCDNWKHNPSVKVQCCKVGGESINIFVDEECDLLSTDTEGADYEILKGLRAKPSIVIIEIDSALQPDREGFNSGGGASYLSMLGLGSAKGYFLLAHTGNLIFIDIKYRNLFPEIEGDGLSNTELYFNYNWLRNAA